MYTPAMGNCMKSVPMGWLIKDSPAHQKLVKILQAKPVIRDVKKCPTDGKHLTWNVCKPLLYISPQNTHFGYLGMLARCQLAALHYNENAHKEHAKTESGYLRFNVSYDKKLHGKPVAKAIKDESTFDYVGHLVQETLQLCSMYSYANAPGPSSSIPPPLRSKYPAMSKMDVIQRQMTRFQKTRIQEKDMDYDMDAASFISLQYNADDEFDVGIIEEGSESEDEDKI